MIPVPEFITLEAECYTVPATRWHPYGDAFVLTARWPEDRWCPFRIPDSAPFNDVLSAEADFRRKYTEAKARYLDGGGEDFKDPEFRIHCIYG